MSESQVRVNDVFQGCFGRTPLKQRLDDILNKAINISRASDDKTMNEEIGNCLCSLLALCSEKGVDSDDLIDATLQKISRRRTQYKSLGRKTKVAILGGAYNPIHLGHIRTAQFVLNTSKSFDEVYLMPCFNHMYGKELLSAKHRLEMCRLSAQVDGRIKVLDYEIKHKLSGETYQTIKKLQEDKAYKNTHDFSLIIGQDNANSFDKWVNSEYLEKLIPFVVVPREGVEVNKKVNWYLKAPHIYLNNEDSKIGEISSTSIRTLLSAYWCNVDKERWYEKLSHYLDMNVLNYIIANKLYQ